MISRHLNLKCVSPASRGGRGLKLVHIGLSTAAGVVAPASRGGRGLKHFDAARTVFQPHRCSRLSGRERIETRFVERLSPGCYVAPASRGGRGLKPSRFGTRNSLPEVAPASRGGRGLKLAINCE